MSSTPSYRALVALLCIASCTRAPSHTAADSTRTADSSMAAGVPATPPAESVSAPAPQPATPAPAPADTTSKPSPAAPAQPTKPSSKPVAQTPTRTADTGQQTASKPAQPAETSAGSSQQAAADAPLRDPYHTAPLDTVDAKTYQGWKLFNLNCSRCHGEDVNGTTIAPHLIVSLKPNGPIPDEATFQTTVCGGRVPKGMPSWCALGMTPATIDTIYAYVKGRSDAKIHPGRPARKS